MKDLILSTNVIYVNKSLPNEQIVILEVQGAIVLLKNITVDHIFMKTTKWCRKNLITYDS